MKNPPNDGKRRCDLPIHRPAYDFTNVAFLFPAMHAYFDHPHADVEWEWCRVQEGWLVYLIDRVRDEDRQWKGVGASLEEALRNAVAAAMEGATK